MYVGLTQNLLCQYLLHFTIMDSGHKHKSASVTGPDIITTDNKQNIYKMMIDTSMYHQEKFPSLPSRSPA